MLEELVRLFFCGSSLVILVGIQSVLEFEETPPGRVCRDPSGPSLKRPLRAEYYGNPSGLSLKRPLRAEFEETPPGRVLWKPLRAEFEETPPGRV